MNLPLVIVLAVGLAALAVVRPITRTVLVSAGRRAGVYLDDPQVVRVAAKATTLVLDGIGSLVDGKTVTSTDPVEPDHLRNLRWFAGALEKHTDHTIGRALARLAPPGRGAVTGVEHHPGRGVSGAVDQHPVRVGSPEWIGVPDDTAPEFDTVAVEVDHRLMGTFTLADHIRDNAGSAVADLESMGIDVVIATDGDPARAEVVAEQVGIDRIEKADAEQVADATAAAGARPVIFPGRQLPVDVPDIIHAAEAFQRARRFVPAMWTSTAAVAGTDAVAVLGALLVG